MTTPYLILHRVRNQPAFDIAERIECPACTRADNDNLSDNPTYAEIAGCHVCGSTGFWWIIPTSGHRAYPWFYRPLTDWHIASTPKFNVTMADAPSTDPMPSNWPDHYPTTASPHTPSPTGSLAQRLGLVPKAVEITRRI